jgi:hypothetical protein
MKAGRGQALSSESSWAAQVFTGIEPWNFPRLLRFFPKKFGGFAPGLRFVM